MEEELLGAADVVFTGGLSLYEAKRGRHPNLHAFPSSIDVGHFGKARSCRDTTAPVAQNARPRLGFFGVIDERLDLELIAAAAALRPDWQFEIVGPVVKIDAATLPQRDNIHWSGPCAYADLPQKLAGWDIGIMPFALNEATRFISPTKTPEFLAAGLPVVSTPIVDVVRSYGEKGLVEIAVTAAAFVEAAQLVLDRPREPWLRAVDKQLAASSWDQTWDAMAGHLRRAQRSAARPALAPAGPAPRADRPTSSPVGLSLGETAAPARSSAHVA
jgi:glycosyltransferase involved in cell wall biosynthesis